MPWRPLGASIASLGVPTGLAIVDPTLAETSIGVELLVALTIIATALFGSLVLSERAFRLMRWIADRPEPPAPPSSQSTGPGAPARPAS